MVPETVRVESGASVWPPTTKVGFVLPARVVTGPGPGACSVLVLGPGFAPMPVATKHPTPVHAVVISPEGFPPLFEGGFSSSFGGGFASLTGGEGLGPCVSGACGSFVGEVGVPIGSAPVSFPPVGFAPGLTGSAGSFVGFGALVTCCVLVARSAATVWTAVAAAGAVDATQP